MAVELWQIIVALLTVSSLIIAPSVWFTRHQATRTEASTKEMIEAVTLSQEKSSNQTRDDLKEFRNHFDKRIGEIYSSIDTKNKELREYINTEMTYIKKLFHELDQKIDVTREKSHEIEKELMRVQNDFQKNYVSHDHFNAIIRLQKMEPSD